MSLEAMLRVALLLVLGGLTAATGCGGGGASTNTPASDNSTPIAPARTVTRNCASRVEGGRLEPDPTSDVRVGPIIFYGLLSAGHRPPKEFVTRHGFSPAWKTVTEVTASTRATLIVTRADRDHLALIYGDFISGHRPGYKLGDGSSAVRFKTCSPNEPAFSRRGTVGPRTQFNGGFIVGKPGCYHVAVRVTGSKRTFRRVIGFGNNGHSCPRPSG